MTKQSKLGTAPDAAGVLDILDAAYAPASGLKAWLERVTQACSPYLDHGIGVEAYAIDLRTPGHAELRDPILVGGTEEWQRVWRENWWVPFMEAMDDEARLRVHSIGTCVYATEIWEAVAHGIPTFRELLAHLATTRYGRTHARYAPPDTAPRGDTLFYPDSWNVFAIEPSGLGVVLAANRAEPARAPALPAMNATWARVAAHLTAALRLRDRVAPSQRIDDADAILDVATGRIAHASAELASARTRLDGLRAVMLEIERVHSKAVDGDEALDTWRALHEGRYSILDAFDRDGRRYYLAHANSPSAAPTKRISAREQQVLERLAIGHSNKLIGYELGIATSTVAKLVARVSKKLGVKSRVELIVAARRSRSRAPDDGEPPDA